jgi:Hypothetical glycosyl hydrolase 6/Beta-galactosidase trimerisation domain
MAGSLRFRQVHLDFHTSEAIPGIAANFDANEFADMLQQAHVNSVTCFARCHHGWLYYDSPRYPELVHPGLANRNLLKQQIEACHARGIRVPIYITVQWDHRSAMAHPEWLTLGADGKVIGSTPEPFDVGFYRFLCINSPYRDFLMAHTWEVFENSPVDGIFFDIVQPVECVCGHCRAQMVARGLDPTKPADRREFAIQSINAFKRDMTAFVRSFSPDCTVFYNAGHIGPRHRSIIDAYTHLELESLPSGGWGYLHFPLTMRYARNLGVDCLGMTGKFHTSWGDFHSFKNLAALQYETFSMLAMGAKCSIGDQLHPSGTMSAPTYDLIGKVYAEVEKKEPWCEDAHPLTDIGVFTPEEFHGGSISELPAALMGAVRMLTEGGHQFDVLDSQSDLDRYALLILPDEIPVNGGFASHLKDYLARGGKLLASYHAGLLSSPEQPGKPVEGFALPEFGIHLVGDAPFSPDFLLAKGPVCKGLPETEHVLYLKGLQVEPLLYFAHPIFTQYNENAPRWVKILLLNAIDLLLPNPLLRHDGPSTVVVTVNEQAEADRQVIHLLHYIPERRGQSFDVIEDVIPLYNLKLSVRADQSVKNVTLVPQGQALEYTRTRGRLNFTVPQIKGHQMVEISYA